MGNTNEILHTGTNQVHTGPKPQPTMHRHKPITLTQLRLFRPSIVLAFTKPILKTLENLELKPKVKVPLFNQEEKFYELVDVADFLNSIYEHIKGGILHQPAT